jgi:hypothetical protein
MPPRHQTTRPARVAAVAALGAAVAQPAGAAA